MKRFLIVVAAVVVGLVVFYVINDVAYEHSDQAKEDKAAMADLDRCVKDPQNCK